MDKIERFQNAYDYLYGRGEYHSKSDLAKRLGRTRTNVSEAYYGRQPYFTDRFLMSFCKEFPIINSEWLINGTGEMINKQEIPSGDMPSWADAMLYRQTQQEKEMEELRRMLKATLEKVDVLTQKLDAVLKTYNYQIQTLHGAYLTAAEPK